MQVQSQLSKCLHLYGIILLIWGMSLVLSGCAKKAADSGKTGELRNEKAQVRIAEASGEVTWENEDIVLDASHTSDGYFMLKYSGTNEKVKIQSVSPDGTEYTYPVTVTGEYAVYPLPGGDGTYKIMVLESANLEKNLYAISFSQELEVQIEDEFSPFLYPNYYVDFSVDSQCVKKGEELAKDCYTDLDVVTNIYNFVIENISYDEEKASDVPYGYTPDPDRTLAEKKGICFDYASLMSAMLRSQRIPTRLEVGYSGEVYHAWISCYVDEIGWVDDIIKFDGKSWSLIDPTLGAGNKASDVKKYISNHKNYITKYTY